MTSNTRVLQRSLKALASSLALTAKASALALLLASCLSAQDSPPGDQPELVSSAPGALTCGCGTCPNSNDCTSVSCGLMRESCCVLKPVKKEGEECVGPQRGQTGTCVQNDCCLGCVAKQKDGSLACAAGDATTACGSDGNACRNCNDSNPCTTDRCDSVKGCTSTAVADRTSCPNGLCYGGVCCTGCIDAQGACQQGNLAAACGIAGGSCEACADDNSCTDDVCNQGQCNYPKKADGASCETDDDICNGKSACQSGECKSGAPLKCDDGNPCTDDSCDPTLGCTSVNNATDCQDGNPCTIGDKCSGGGCKAGEPVVCNDNEFCTDDVCDPISGCLYKPKLDGTECDDGSVCTLAGDACAEGKCVGSGGPICDDQNPCTKNGCSLTSGCDYESLEQLGTPCVGENKCLVNAKCDSQGKCAGGLEKDCNDNNPCTRDGCDSGTGACVNTPLDTGSCSDGSACTVNDSCRNGRCQGDPLECAPLDDCHVPGRCDETTGVCGDPRAKDGTSCEADTGTCKSGRCVTNPVVVPEGGAGGAPVTIEGGSSNGATAGAPASEGGATTIPAEGGAGTEPGSSGGTSGTAGSNSGGTSGLSSGGSAASGTDTRGEPFQRDPGGCACSLHRNTGSTGQLALLLSLLGLAGWRREGRRREQRRER